MRGRGVCSFDFCGSVLFFVVISEGRGDLEERLFSVGGLDLFIYSFGLLRGFKVVFLVCWCF